MTRLHRTVLALAGLAFILSTVPAHAQDEPDPDDPGVPQVSGVYIDAAGMVRNAKRDLVAAARAAKLRAMKDKADPTLVYISVPRLLEDARNRQAAGKAIPDDVRFLRGMTKLQYIFVDTETNDLVIAGPSEKLDNMNPRRPVGVRTGRPALQLDDLVMAFRLAGPDARKRGFGCSIDMPTGAQEAVNRIMSGPKTKRETRLADLAEAVGPQTVRIINLAADTRFAATCVEADYALKRLTIGLDRSPVPSVRYRMGRGGAQFTRWWFAGNDAPALAADATGTTFEITGPTLAVVTAPEANSRGKNAVAEQYAERFTAKIDEFAAAVPEIADLWNLTDLALLAALVKSERIDRKIGWDVRSIASYKVAKVVAPKTADTLVNHASSTYAVGGVWVEPAGLLRRVSEALEARETAPIGEGNWFRVD